MQLKRENIFYLKENENETSQLLPKDIEKDCLIIQNIFYM